MLFSRGKIILGYSETELCMKGSGYQFIHAADMMYCADNHIRSMFALHAHTQTEHYLLNKRRVSSNNAHSPTNTVRRNLL